MRGKAEDKGDVRRGREGERDGNRRERYRQEIEIKTEKESDREKR